MGPEINEFRKNTLRPVLADPAFSLPLAIIDDRPPKSSWERLKANLRKGRGGYVLVMAFRRLLAPASAQEDTQAYCARHGIPVHRTISPYGAETLARVRESDIDALVLVDGFGIVRKKMIDAAPLGVLSYHHGDMRKYRGMPPAMWELYHGEREMGVTVQLITPGLDNGRPVVEMTVPIENSDDVDSLTARALRLSEPMLHQALQRLNDPTFVAPRLDTFGPVYTLPDLRQWIRLQSRILMNKLK
jgi:folate-dependent phosphoribosylglycinamide formyltransferase PurN